MILKATFNPQDLDVAFSAPHLGIKTSMEITRDLVERDPYIGDYIITPSAETRALETNGLRMTDNIIIQPIPQNYGLITWDGSTITVS